MAIPVRQLQAEFAAYLDRTHLDARLQLRHLASVAIGLIGSGIVVVKQLTLDPVQAPIWQRHVVLGLGTLFISVCLYATLWAQDAELRRLTVVTEDVEQRASQVAGYVMRRDRLLLAMALIGQVIAWCAMLCGVRLMSADVLLVMLPLLPTVQQAWLGFGEVPSRQRLLFLYKLVALHSERARATRKS